MNQEYCKKIMPVTVYHTHSTAHYPGIISPIWHRRILYFTGDEIQHFELFQYQEMI